jgi:hypothetical protein
MIKTENKICPFLKITWFSTGHSIGDSENLNRCCKCEQENCMAYDSGKCKLMDNNPFSFMPILRSRDIQH